MEATRKPDDSVPRGEHPRPQFRRDDYVSLNGVWQFEIDAGDSGRERGLLERELKERIVVPFCPESELSKIHHRDFMRTVWYRRTFRIPEEWRGRRVLLNFQAVDHEATVWVNGKQVAVHRGGFTPFACELTGIAKPGETATLVVRARDPLTTGQPIGKQAAKHDPYSVFYDRTTGIWQSVWLEAVGPTFLGRPRITPDLPNGVFRVTAKLSGSQRKLCVGARLSDQDGVVSKVRVAAGAGLSISLELPIPEGRRRVWSPLDPFLYDLELTVEEASGNVLDRSMSSCGLRSVAIDGHRLLLNDEPLFMRFVLDQGYYPGGIMTAASDADLERDILLSKQAGFNGARLHQRVFEERFLYHADRLGYLVWGEFPDWTRFGPTDGTACGPGFVAEWLEALERDYSRPSLIGWCGLNETKGPLEDRQTPIDDLTRAFFLAAKSIDPSRPVIDASGYGHRVPETDIYDSHDYIEEPDFEVGMKNLVERHARTIEGVGFTNTFHTPWKTIERRSVPYAGQPYFVSEMGGFRCVSEAKGDSWGYGSSANDPAELLRRIDVVCSAFLDNPGVCGFCYTQLCDIYPEENGIYTFDRKPKLDVEAMRKALSKPAAIEKPPAPNFPSQVL